MGATLAGPPVDRLRDAAAACDDLDALARAVFAVVGDQVPFVFACLATIDPASGLITGAIKSHALPVGDEEFAAAEYGGPDINLISELAARPVPVGALSIDTGGHPERCRRFREFMAPRFGFTDELRLVCRAQRTTWAALALYRGADQPAFTPREARTVVALHEAVAVAVRRVLLGAPDPGPDTGTGPAVLIVDAHDRVTDTSAAAAEAIEQLGGWDGDSLPANVLSAAAAARVRDGPTTSRIRGRSGGWLSVRALALSGPPGGRSVVLTVEPAAPAAVGRLALAARGLTVRETEIVELVLRGESTKAIAATLHLSAHTVQDHLKAVFGKLQVGSRRELIARFAA